MTLTPLPQGVASLDKMDMIGRIYVGDHWILFHAKCMYLCIGSFEFLTFLASCICYCSLLMNVPPPPAPHLPPPSVANKDSRGMVGRIYVGYH